MIFKFKILFQKCVASVGVFEVPHGDDALDRRGEHRPVVAAVGEEDDPGDRTPA